jgi:hypothetical protein
MIICQPNKNLNIPGQVKSSYTIDKDSYYNNSKNWLLKRIFNPVITRLRPFLIGQFIYFLDENFIKFDRNLNIEYTYNLKIPATDLDWVSQCHDGENIFLFYGKGRDSYLEVLDINNLTLRGSLYIKDLQIYSPQKVLNKIFFLDSKSKICSLEIVDLFKFDLSKKDITKVSLQVLPTHIFFPNTDLKMIKPVVFGSKKKVLFFTNSGQVYIVDFDEIGPDYVAFDVTVPPTERWIKNDLYWDGETFILNTGSQIISYDLSKISNMNVGEINEFFRKENKSMNDLIIKKIESIRCVSGMKTFDNVFLALTQRGLVILNKNFNINDGNLPNTYIDLYKKDKNILIKNSINVVDFSFEANDSMQDFIIYNDSIFVFSCKGVIYRISPRVDNPDFTIRFITQEDIKNIKNDNDLYKYWQIKKISLDFVKLDDRVFLSNTRNADDEENELFFVNDCFNWHYLYKLKIKRKKK